MQNGFCILNYTQVLWLYTDGLPEEAKKKLMNETKYRVGLDDEESFTPKNSTIREANGWIVITFRGT